MDGEAVLATWLAFDLDDGSLMRLSLSRTVTIVCLQSHDSFLRPRGPFSIPLRAATGLRVIGHLLAGDRIKLKTASKPSS